MSVTCALCGARKQNDESVIWLGMSWDERQPYCADDCGQSVDLKTCVHEDNLALCRRCENAARRSGAGE